MPRRLPLLLALLLALCATAVAACGGDDSEAESTPTPAAAVEGEEAGCESVGAPEPKPEPDLDKPTETLDPSKEWKAVVSTSCGEFTIDLDVERAPKTTSSFAALARDDFFAGLTFHRVVPGFVIQGGDPLGTGTGGPGYKTREAPPSDLAYTRGVVAMAKGGAEAAGTAGSQFFVVTAEDAGLPPDYALVGQVTEGQDVVDAIGVVQTNPDETPIEPVVIEGVEITEG